MSNNKQSSVEWLIAELGEYFPHEIGGIELMVSKAKEMHKEEIIDSFGVGCQVESTRLIGYYGMAEQYYNEIYGGNNE